MNQTLEELKADHRITVISHRMLIFHRPIQDDDDNLIEDNYTFHYEIYPDRLDIYIHWVDENDKKSTYVLHSIDDLEEFIN